MLNASDANEATRAEQAVQGIIEMLCITTHGADVNHDLLTAAFAEILRSESAADAAAASFIHAVRSAPAPAAGSGQKRIRSEPPECTEPLQAPPSSHKKAKTAKKVQELTAEAEAFMCPISHGPIVDAVRVSGQRTAHIFDRKSIESHLKTHGGSAAHPIERNVRITNESIFIDVSHAALTEAFFNRVAKRAAKHPEAYADLQAMAFAWTEERKKLAAERTLSTVTPTAGTSTGTIYAGPEPMSYDSHTTHQHQYSYSPTSPNYWPVPGYEPPSPAHSPTDPDQVPDPTISADEPRASTQSTTSATTPPPLANGANASNGANAANGPDLYANIPLIEIQDSDDEAGEAGEAGEEDRRNQGADRMDEHQAPTKSSHIIGCLVSWCYDDTKQIIGWVIAREVTGPRATLIIRTPSGSIIEADSLAVCPAPVKQNDTVTILGPDIDGNRSYIGRSGVVSGFIGDSRSNAIVTMADTTAHRIFAQGACAPMLTVN